MKFIKINERYLNTEHIAYIYEDNGFYNIRMSNADFIYLKIDKESKKLINEVLGNAELQLPSERITKRVNRSIQRPAK